MTLTEPLSTPCLFFWDRLWELLGEKYLSDKTFLPGLDMEKAVRTVTFVDAAEMLCEKFGFGSAEDIYKLMYDFCVDIYRNEATFKPGAKEIKEGDSFIKLIDEI